MKKLILPFMFFATFFSSCEKNGLEKTKQKTNILLNDHLVTSKIKQTNSGLTLTSSFNPKTGEVVITPSKKTNVSIFVSYKSYKKVNEDFILNSNLNYGRYINSFVVSNYNLIPVGVKQKLDLEVRTSNGGYFNFIFEEKRK